jgi:hypothetical protein
MRGQLARPVRAGGLRKRTDGNISTAPQVDPTAGPNRADAPPPGRAPAAAAVALRPSRRMPGGWRAEREARRAAAERQAVDR